MSRRLEQFCVFCRGRARENKGSLVYKASVETGSESLHATHGTGAEAQPGFPGWFPSCWTGMPCARGNFVICFMVVKYVIEGPPFDSLLPVLMFTVLGLGVVSAAELFNVTETKEQGRKPCCEDVGQAAIVLGPPSVHVLQTFTR